MKLMAQRRIQSSCATVLIAAGAALALPATAQAGSVLDIAYTVDVAGATVLNAQYRSP